MQRLMTALFASLLLSRVGLAAEAARPASRGSSPLASPIHSVVTADSPGARYIKSLTADQQKQLDKEGEILLGEQKADSGGSGTYGGYIRAVAIFHQNKKRVFELMTDTVTQALYLPHLTGATVMAHQPNGELTEFVLKIMWRTMKLHVQHWFYPEQSRSEWALDTTQANDIKAQEGYWQLFELGPDTTVGEYGTKVDTGLAVPAFIQNMFARADIPKALTAFRKYMDSNGKYRRDD